MKDLTVEDIVTCGFCGNHYNWRVNCSCQSEAPKLTKEQIQAQLELIEEMKQKLQGYAIGFGEPKTKWDRGFDQAFSDIIKLLTTKEESLKE